MTDGPCDFLSTFEDQLAEHRDANCAAHASIAEHIEKKDLPGLMSYATDQHGIQALTPDDLKPCAQAIRGFGDAALACTAECSAFVKTAEQHLGSLLESCKEGTHGTRHRNTGKTMQTKQQQWTARGWHFLLWREKVIRRHFVL